MLRLSMDQRRTFLNIPHEEHIVPFPNTAALILQHAREFPEKIAFRFKDRTSTYAHILNYCLTFKVRENERPLLSFRDPEKSLFLLLALLYQGIPFDLNFHAECDRISFTFAVEQTRDIPFIRPDDEACILNETYLFSQYNLLVAAQAVGRAFRLFRPGDACCALPIQSMNDLLFAVLAPLYFAKSIRFDTTNPAEEVLNAKAQYAWCREVFPATLPKAKELLRDAALLIRTEKQNATLPAAYYLSRTDDSAAGLAIIYDVSGEIVPLPGCDFVRDSKGKLQINGHAVAISCNKDKSSGVRL